MPAPNSVEEIRAKLTAERAKLLESFKGLPPDALTRPHEDGWSIKDLLAHIAMAEGVNVKFASMMLGSQMPVQLDELAREYPDYPLPFELDKFNAWMTEQWRRRSLVEVIDELHNRRQATLAWLATLSPEQLDRGGQHAVWGSQSVRGMFRILMIHDRFHRADIDKRRI